MEVVPYKDNSTGKKEQVAVMFDNISGKYDFLNHFLSFGIDILWRKKAIRMLNKNRPEYILDVATGTGDFAIEALKLNPEKIIGIDISKGMLEVGRNKINKLNLQDRIELRYGDSENLPFEDNKFDAVIVAFGVGNFENLDSGLKEIYRVMTQGGKAVILEFSVPEVFPLKQLFNFYFNTVLPQIGRFISKDNAAYSYLPESVKEFPNGEDFVYLLKNVGFKKVSCNRLTFGISAIYTGQK